MAKQVVINDRTAEALKQIQGLTKDGMAEFVETAKEIAADNVPVDTGDLRDTIASDNPKENEFRVFTGTGYGGYVELGTAHMAAQPYLAPAIDETIREFNDGGKWS